MIKKNSKQTGFGLIELIVAMALFTVVVTTGLTTVIGSFDVNRLDYENTAATAFAQAGIESVYSLQNQDWSSVFLGTDCSGGCGITNQSGTLGWSGTSNTQDGMTRVLTVSPVERDGSGAIVSSGGTVDPDTYKVTSTVNWDFNAARQNSIELITYLTQFDKPIVNNAVAGGMLVYADLSGDDDVIRYKLLDTSGNWGSEQTVPALNVPRNRDTQRVDLYSSPDRNEKILISKHVANGPGDDHYLYAQVWNGSSWGNLQQLASWTGSSNSYTRDYDGGYLANGNFFLVYENDTDIVRYRTWNGSSWSGQSNGPDVGNNPVWVKLRVKPNSNEALLVTLDSGEDTNTSYWNGSSWSSVLQHGSNTSGRQTESIDFAWNSANLSQGALMFNDSNNDTTPNIAYGNSSWTSSFEPLSIGGAGRNYQIANRPGTSSFLGCTRDSRNDINCLTSVAPLPWTSVTELETNSESGFAPNFDVAYEQTSGTTAVIVYSGSPTQEQPKFRTFNPITSSWSSEADMADIGDDLESVIVIPNPANNTLMFLLGTSDQDVWSVAWDGESDTFFTTGAGALQEHGTSGTGDNNVWFDFAWDL